MANTKDLLNDIEKTRFYHSELIDFEELPAQIHKDSHGLKIITQNTRSIYKNFDSFQVILSELKVKCDILILTETRTDLNRPFPIYNNYNLAFSRNCRNQNDGVVVYTSIDIDCFIEEPEFDDGNCLIIKLDNDSIIISIYRSPSYKNIDVFLNSLDSILRKHESCKNICIIGDINIDIKKNFRDPIKEREKIKKKGYISTLWQSMG